MTNIVTRINFERYYREIEKNLKECTFVSIDCEFTGLMGSKSVEISLFDTAEERYQKYRYNMSTHIPLQIGISTYKFNSQENKYDSQTYTIYTLPREIGQIKPCFSMDSSAVAFHCQNKFDFNKVFYEGLSYLNRYNEYWLLNSLDNNNLLDEELFAATIKTEFKRIKKDLVKGNVVLDGLEPEVTYLLRKKLEKEIKEVYTFYNSEGELIIKKCANQAECNDFKKSRSILKTIEGDLFQSILGFTRIFRLLSEAKKPIIGHNMYLDLIVMYHQFENPLPKSYLKFKSEVNRLFPIVYDTKYLSYIINKLPKPVPSDNIGTYDNKKAVVNQQWPMFSLGKMYEYFKEDEINAKWKFGTPSVISTGPYGGFHNAGWDSFCTGYCFVHLASIYVSICNDSKIARPVTSIEMLKLCSKLSNRINVIHGGILYMNLLGKDPPFARSLLYATKLRTGRGIFKNQEITDIDIKALRSGLNQFGSIEIEKLSSKTNLVIAVGNQVCAEKIINQHQKLTKIWKIQKYNKYIHNVRVLRWLTSPKNLVWYIPVIGASYLAVLYARKYNIL